MRKTAIAILMAGLMIGVAAAQTQGSNGQQNQANQATATTQNGREVLGGTEPEQRIQRETLHELLMIPYYSVFDDLRFEVNGDTVKLMGAVTNPTVKSDAENRVKKIEGVQNVVNNIKVLPPSPTDDRIRREEYRAIYSSDGLYRYAMGAVPSIHIIVENGHVTLTGMVDNAADKNIAKIRANSVPGVFSVKNDLQVGNNKQVASNSE